MKKRPSILICLLFALACSSDGPAPAVERETPNAQADTPFPPRGPIELKFGTPPEDGVLYQLLVQYEGRTEVTPLGERLDAQAQSADELFHLELDFRQLPVGSATADDVATSLVLDSLRRRLKLSPPGSVHVIELADDRLRVMQNEKIDVDLRGAQPKNDITPRALLNRPFALLVNDRFGNPKGVTLRGIPSAKKMLSTIPLRETLGYMQITFPDRAIAPGETWKGKRYLASPAGRAGISVDLDYRLVGFEEIQGVPCARVSLRANREDKKVPSALGFVLDELRLQLIGDAWIDLETGLVELVRIQDIVAVAFERSTAGTKAVRSRMRYETRASLQRLHLETTAKLNWADGTKRFVDVDKGKSLGLKGAQ